MNPPWELIEAYLDDELDAKDEARFCDWLSANPQHVQLLVREVHLHQALRAEAQARSAQARAGAPQSDATGFQAIAAAVSLVLGAWRISWRLPSALAACGVLLVGL